MSNRNPKRDEAYEIWKKHKGEITNKAIAELVDAPAKTISAWKSRDKWTASLKTNECSTTRDERSTANKKRSTTTKKDSREVPVKRKAQKNRSGNPNPENQFTKRNTAARTHGLRSKYFTGKQREIMEDFQDVNLIEQLWMQIEIKFSAIIQMQSVMWVEDADDHLREESGSSQGVDGDSISYKVIYAHERFGSYVRAQARAMAEYRNLVKQYIELTDEFDERRMKLEGMQLNIDKSKVELEYLQGDSDDDSHELMQQYLKAIGPEVVEDIFADEGDVNAED